MTVSLTIFTPTYNRAYCLHRCYESLCRQSCKDFLWLIIDDGSTDDTRAIVEEWEKEEKGFKIRYIYKENGGLYSGYNVAAEHLDTPLAVCVDSDDWMPDDAVELILRFWKQNGDQSCAGIIGLDCVPDGTILAEPFRDEKINLIDLAVGRYHLRGGDRKLVVRSELYKSVAPMKGFRGEKDFNPHYMHLQISRVYDFLVLNEPLCFVDYQPDGMTNTIFQQYLRSPNSFREYRLLELSFPDTPLEYRIRKTIHYISSCILSKQPCISATPQKLLAGLLYPLGWLFSLYVKKRGKQ